MIADSRKHGRRPARSARQKARPRPATRPAETAPPAPAQPPQLRLLFWETTAACNLQCRHCRRLEVSPQPSHRDLSTGQARSLIEAIARLGKPILVLSGGEPLLRPDILELAEFAHQQGLPAALASNGTMIDAELAGRIKAAHVRRVAVSLDGADEAAHDRLRLQQGSFAAACNGLLSLRAAGLSTQVNCTVGRHNFHQLDRIYELAVELGADALHLFMLVPVGCGAQLPSSELLPAELYERVLNWVYDRSRDGRLFVRPTCAPHYFRIVCQRGRRAAAPGPKNRHALSAMTRGCLAGQAVCFVSHDGRVFPCGYLPIECGNVTERELPDIWRDSAVFARLRDPSQLTGKCGRCPYARVCGGCRARAFADCGDYMGPEPFCSFVPPPPSGPRAPTDAAPGHQPPVSRR